VRSFLVVLLILSPAILYAIALGVTALVSTFYSRKCPACSERGLKSVNFIRATIVIDGRRAPDFWSYYECDRCGAGFKLHHDEWTRVEAAELKQYSHNA
jgi:hypothetical protein